MLLLVIATILARGIRASREAALGGAECQGVHLLGPIGGHAVLSGSAVEVSARSVAWPVARRR